MGSFSLDDTRMFFIVLFPLKLGYDGILMTNILKALPKALHVWYDCVPFRCVPDVFVVAVVVTVAAFACDVWKIF